MDVKFFTIGTSATQHQHRRTMQAKLQKTMKAVFVLGAVLAVCSVSSAGSNETSSGIFMPAQLESTMLRAYAAPEADQGVAVDADNFYTVDNSLIAKYDKVSGNHVAIWDGRLQGQLSHLNSCKISRGYLECANSNYPTVPHASSIETFDPVRLKHLDSHSLGIMDEGSLTWIDRIGGGYIAGFAHYSGRGGVTFKDATHGGVVRFDEQGVRTGGWAFPESVLDRLVPHSASGGAIGPDGYLYVMGHDRPEIYALAKPSMGPTLVHIATITTQARGQAFSWDDYAFCSDGARTIFAIDRKSDQVLQLEIPTIPDVPDNGTPFVQDETGICSLITQN